MTAALFATSVLLWGGGALMSALQAGIVPAPVSVSYRMAAAAVLLLGWAGLRGVRLTVPAPDRLWVAAQGVLFFGVPFTAFYEATRLIPSGLAALVLSMAPVFATVLAGLCLGSRPTLRTVSGIALGTVGVALVFGLDLPATLDPATALRGLGLSLVAAGATAGGTVIGARNQRAGLPVLATLAWGAIVGAMAAAGWAMAIGADFTFDPSARYMLSLAYLAVLASVAAFLIYFELVGRLGPGRAAYIFAVVPVVALLLSSLFEGLALAPLAILGVAIILAGNLIVLRG